MFSVSGAASAARAAILGVAAAAPILVSAGAATAQQLTFKAGPVPKVDLAPNAAYGSVRFKLDLLRNNRPSTQSIFDALLTGLGGLMKEEGQYTLTVELLGAGDEVLARRAIMSAQRRSSGWFIFNRRTTESQAVEWYGDFPSSVLIRDDTNQVRVKVRSYYSQESKFDLETFNLLADFITKAKLLGAANTALDATWKPLAQQIEGLLSSYKQSDVSDVATLSFADLGGSTNPASGTFLREYSVQPSGDGPAVKYAVRLMVETTTRAARVARVVNGKVAGGLSYGDVLAASRIGDQPIDLVLGTSKNDAVNKFFADLNSSAGYADADIGERCDRTLEELSRHFTVTDKVISYWALLHLYRRKLAANAGAKECLNTGVRQQMAGLGLPLDDLAFASGAAVVASGDQKSATREAAAAVEKIVPSNQVVDKLLGEKNTSKTFQVFPIQTTTD